MNTKSVKTITLTLIAGLLFVSLALVLIESGNIKLSEANQECLEIPQFGDYNDYNSDVPINLHSEKNVDFRDSEEALNFKSEIEEWFDRGAQSGGYYAVAEWGCGTSCQDHAIIDIRDGRITWFGLPSTHGIGYRINSNLLVINPLWNVESDRYLTSTTSTKYYELKRGIPKFICEVATFPKN